MAVFTKIVSEGDPASYTLSMSGSAEWRSGVMAEVTGADTGSLAGAHAINATNTGATATDPQIAIPSPGWFRGFAGNDPEGNLALNSMKDFSHTGPAFISLQQARPSYHTCYVGYTYSSGEGFGYTTLQS